MKGERDKNGEAEWVQPCRGQISPTMTPSPLYWCTQLCLLPSKPNHCLAQDWTFRKILRIWRTSLTIWCMHVQLWFLLCSVKSSVDLLPPMSSDIYLLLGYQVPGTSFWRWASTRLPQPSVPSPTWHPLPSVPWPLPDLPVPSVHWPILTHQYL